MTRPTKEQVAAAVERARTPYSHFHRLKEEIVSDNEVLFEALTQAQAELDAAMRTLAKLPALRDERDRLLKAIIEAKEVLSAGGE